MDHLCAEKNCDRDGPYGMRWDINDVWVEFSLCAEHFDAIAEATEVDTEPERVQ